MAPNDSAQTTEEAGVAGPVRRRKAARYALPVAVAGVAAATIGLVPALAASGDPELPKVSAQELIEKIAASDTQQLSGTIKVNTDLGLPDFGGLADSFLSGMGEAGAGGEGKGGSSASPDAKLMELASGSHTLRVAVDGPERQKLSILEDTAEYSLIRNGAEVWAYDSKANEVVHHKGEGPGKGGAKGDGKGFAGPEDLPTTPKELAAKALEAADKTTSVTVDGTAKVAGRSAYQLVIKPKQSGSTIGSIKVAVDSKTGTPLKFTLLPSSGGKAAVDVGFTKVDFSRPAASTFDFAPPKGAKVTESDELAKQSPEDFGVPELEGELPELPKELEKELKDGLKGGEGLKDLEGLKDPEGLKDLEGLEGLEGFGGPQVIGEGWTTIGKIESPAGEGFAPPKKGELPPAAEGFLNSFGDPVSGKFGSGTVFKTRLVNALMTDDGTVYVGAVTKDELVKAANADK
ncbi:outer membrane lipoprotein carrier protein LolA [Streptomyces sp. NPDC017979]|uniref:outer membrane lipoprotein carrier protein LolA n=1 Tax=Streptomyces sp. NPDC017979 TaxID=3365024 RepID=UPI003790EF20